LYNITPRKQCNNSIIQPTYLNLWGGGVSSLRSWNIFIS